MKMLYTLKHIFYVSNLLEYKIKINYDRHDLISTGLRD